MTNTLVTGSAGRVCSFLVTIASLCFLMSSNTSVGAETNDTNFELGGFIGLMDVVVNADGNMIGAAGNGIAMYNGQSWRAIKIFDDNTELTAMDVDGDVVWAAGPSCDLVKIVGKAIEIFHLDLVCSMTALVSSMHSEAIILSGRVASGDGIVARYDNGEVTVVYSIKNTILWSVAESKSGNIAVGGDGVVAIIGPEALEVFRDEWLGCTINKVKYSENDELYVGGFCLVENPGRSSFVERPLMAVYRDGKWERQEVIVGGRMIVDFIVKSGWAVGDGLIIYRFDGAAWKPAFDGGGGLNDPFNAIEEIDDKVYFVGSMATMVIYQNGIFSRYMDSRNTSHRTLWYDKGNLTRLSVRADGYGIAVGGGGSPVERISRNTGWSELTDIESEADIISVAVGDEGTWFGSAEHLPREEPVFIERTPGGDYRIQYNATKLSIWDIDYFEHAGGWAVASTRGAEIPARQVEVLQLTDDTWSVRCHIAGDEIFAVAGLNNESAIAVGTSVIVCDSRGNINRIDGIDGMASNVHYDGRGVVLIAATTGIWQFDVNNDSVQQLLVTNEPVLSVVARDECIVATGSTTAWVRNREVWDQTVIAVASWYLGPFAFSDTAIDSDSVGDSTSVLASGQWNSIVRLERICGSLDDTTPRTATESAVPHETPVPTIVMTATRLPLHRVILPVLMQYHWD
ncbi:MAG: hypothetical protein IPG72_07085 [Ardenticatenales bacterium]|nr:hypothetical protein [Ardenticatenales bacterium]